MKRFLAELKRRKVVRAVAAYAIAAFVVIQAADPVVDLLMLPGWTLRLVFALAILGLPVVIGLAWAFDWGPGGLEPAERAAESGGAEVSKAEGSAVPVSWRIAVIGAVMVLALGGGAWVLWGGDGAGSGSQDRVLVLPLDNATGDPELDAVGRMAADWIIQGLVDAELGTVVPLADAEDMLRVAGGEPGATGSTLAEVAASAGAGLVVTGTVYQRGDSVEIRGRILAGDGGRVLDAIPAQAAPRTDPIAAVESLQRAALGLLASRLGRPFGDEASLADIGVRAPSIEAYQLYVEGMQHFSAQEYPQARRLFLEAEAADTSWFAPRVHYLMSSINLGDDRTADSMFTALRPHRSSMSRTDRLIYDWLQTWMEGNPPAGLEIVREHALDVWGENGRYGLALELLRNNYPAESAAVLEEGDPAAGWNRNWTAYVSVHTAALHYSGQHRQELEVARSGRELYPNLPSAVFWEARALAALDRPGEAVATLRAAMTLPPGRGWTPGWMQLQSGLELRRHGHGAAGEAALRRGLEWYRSGDREADYPYSIARAHLWLGEVEQALSLLQELAEESPGSLDVNGRLGLALARAGRAGDAREVDARLAKWDDPYVRGSHLFWRAAIAAELGEKDRAVTLLRDAIAEGVPYSALHEDEDLRALWDFPPFQELIEPRG